MLRANLFKFVFAMMGKPYVDANEETWKRSMVWDYEHTNEEVIWDTELNKEALQTASDLATSAPERAFEIWLELAGQGSVWAMIEAARCAGAGIGVARDIQQSENWYRRATERGSQSAMLRYAELLRARRDYKACEETVLVFADQGWAPAMFWLAWYRLKQSETRAAYLNARPLLEEAAGQGHPEARWLLARYMAQGRFGLSEVLRGQRLMWENSAALADSVYEPSGTA